MQKNGHTEQGAQRVRCLDCQRTFTLSPKGPRYDQKFKDQVAAACQDRMSIRGSTRTCGVCHQTVMAWVGEKSGTCPPSRTRCCQAKRATCSNWMNFGSFAGTKTNACRLWLALCRRTRQIVACVLGDRSAESARGLRANVPADYRRLCHAQRLLAGLRRGFPPARAPLLRQAGRRNQPRRTLVWHGARPAQPAGAPLLFLFQEHQALDRWLITATSPKRGHLLSTLSPNSARRIATRAKR